MKDFLTEKLGFRQKEDQRLKDPRVQQLIGVLEYRAYQLRFPLEGQRATDPTAAVLLYPKNPNSRYLILSLRWNLEEYFRSPRAICHSKGISLVLTDPNRPEVRFSTNAGWHYLEYCLKGTALIPLEQQLDLAAKIAEPILDPRTKIGDKLTLINQGFGKNYRILF